MMFSESDKRTLQTAVVAGVVAMLGLFYYSWAFVNPDIGGTEKSIADLQEEIKRKEATLAELKKWEGRTNEIASIVQDLEAKVQRLPKTSEASDFLRILRDCVRRTNLSDIKIGRVRNVPMGAYEEIPYMITCRARYHDLGQFLTLVEQHPDQIMRLKTLSMASDLRRPSRLNVVVQVATFAFTESLPKTKEVASK
jgi:Tfp pilus assembly protein PilO